jgi:hypothetical protein
VRILFTTTGHAGHALPLVPFARACLRAGHDVHNAILAKATVGGIGLATCRLLAGDDFDETSFNNPTIKSTTSTLTLTVLHSSDASFKARLRCGDGKRDGSLIGFLEDIKLTAVKVDQLSNKAG